MNRRDIVVVWGTAVIMMTAVILLGGTVIRHRAASQRTVCLQNLQSLDSAIRAVAALKGWSDGHAVDRDLIAVHMPGGRIPRCPSGAEYVIGNVGEMRFCPVHGRAPNADPLASGRSITPKQ